MKDRLEKLMKAEGLSSAKFAEEIGVQPSSISHILSGRNKPSYDFITKILERFQGINAEWLLTGRGSMIKGQESLQDSKEGDNSLFDISEVSRDPGYGFRNISGDEKKATERDDNTPESNPVTIVNANKENNKITNVNNVDYILVFYKDGSFKQYNSRD